MSELLIKGIELPLETSGVEIFMYNDGRTICRYLGEDRWFEVEVIELRPHGDLIERDTAIDEMEYVSFDTAYNCELAQEVLRYNVPVFLEASND